MTDVAIAIDIGGTGIKSALVDSAFQPTLTRRTATEAERGPDAVIQTIVSLAGDLADAAESAGDTPVAVGLAAPGVIDEATGVAVWSANVGFRDVPLKDLVEARLKLPTALGHDVRAAARAEATLGGGRGARRAWFVAIGTGIAAAYVVDGHTDPGAHGSSGEIGHVVVRADGPKCGCGRHGCLEALASAASVARRYWERTAEAITAEQVVKRAAAGEPAAASVWAETIDVLADGLSIGITLYDPEVIVLGGGLAEARELLVEPLKEAVRSRLTFQTMVEIRHAALGDEAGSIGAAMLARDAQAAALTVEAGGPQPATKRSDPNLAARR